nr:MAG TPA: hypothetical protein [Caudoviricetes sp.]
MTMILKSFILTRISIMYTFLNYLYSNQKK